MGFLPYGMGWQGQFGKQVIIRSAPNGFYMVFIGGYRLAAHSSARLGDVLQSGDCVGSIL